MSHESDSDSDEDFCLPGMRGPIIVCEEDEVQAPLDQAEQCLGALQRLELSVLRRDERDVQALGRELEQEGGALELRGRTVRLAERVLRGEFAAVVSSEEAALPLSLLCSLCNSYQSTKDVPEAVRKRVFEFVAGERGGDDDDSAWRAYQVLLLGFAYYSLFCQVNYTGPELSREDAEMLSAAAGSCGQATATTNKTTLTTSTTTPTSSTPLGEQVSQQVTDEQDSQQPDLYALGNKEVLKLLESDGNYAFPLCKLPTLLVLARCLLLALACPLRAGWQAGVSLSSAGEIIATRNEDIFDVNVIKAVRTLCTRQWVSSRALLIHLRLLQKQNYSDNTTLFKEMCDVFDEAESELKAVMHKEYPSQHDSESSSATVEGVGIVPDNTHLLAMLYLERGLGLHFFDHADKGKSLFHQAMQTMGLEATLTAAMGKRTKHQVHDHAQLLLVAKSALLPGTGEYNLAKAMADSEAALEKAFGTKKGKKEVPTTEWEHSEWELGTRIITTSEERNGAEVAIRDVQLDSADGGAAENILLEEGVKFTAPSDSGNDDDGVDLNSRHNVLHPVEQAAILALCLDVSNSNPSGDDLTTEQMFPYLQAVLNMYHNHQHLRECHRKIEKKNEMLRFHSMGKEVDTIDFAYEGKAVEKCMNWMVYSTTLLERSYLEFEKRRTMDRAMMQIQALLDQHSTSLTVFQSSRDDVEEAAPAHLRLQLLPILVYPSQYEIKRDLAQRYLRCQIFNSALNLFTELEMWDEVVTCYQLLQKPRRAEVLVRERLEQGGETPYMVCALADLTQSEELYERAWVLSGKRYARAKRTVARMCFEQGRYQDCCDHLDDALRVQPLVPASWYLKGIACMRIENYSGAMEAFTRCVQQDMEIGEAWGNLAAIHMHCKRFDRAYECLLEAQKYRSREWRLTENLLTVCIETGRYAESLQFMRQLLELRHHKSNAIQKQSVANNSSDVNTVDEHPTPVHIPDLRKLCVVVAIRTVKFVRALDAATASASIEKTSPAVSGGDVDNGIVLPRLTTELEAFLSEILTVMHVDPIYYELLVMYHDLIYTGADVAEDGEEASLENGNLEDRQVAASNSTASPGAAELWARRRSKNAIRVFRLKQFRVLLNRPVWERDEKLVKELFRVIQIVIDCYVEDAGLLSKKDFYGLRSMLKTALSRLETFYQDSRQLEGAAAGEKVSDLNQLHSFISICTEYEEGSVN